MNKIKQLGNIYRDNPGGNFGGNVFDQNGLCPTINVMGGGNRQPIVIEKRVVGTVGSLQEHAVIGDGEVSPCLPAASGLGGGHTPMVVEKYIVASRGRNVENPSDRRAGIELEQRLEVREEGIVGCLTSVSKDNMVLERKRTDKEMDKVEVIKDGYAYRIRKITPKETFLLMGLTEQEYEDAQKVASNSALYKAAGNGLVPNCLVAILGQMLEGREDYYKPIHVENFGDNVDKY